MTTMTTKLTPLYEGSVKTLYAHPSEPETLLFEFTDHFSVFDWGKMPDTIPHKGRVLSLMGGLLMQRLSQPETWQTLKQSPKASETGFLNTEAYETLCKKGLATHFKHFVTPDLKPLSTEDAFASSEPVWMAVRRAEVPTISRHLYRGQLLYEYPPVNTQAACRFIPLEVVFRMGIPEGSSLLSRFEKNPALAKQYGFDSPPKAWDWFKEPIVELYSKLEAEDRKLSEQEALLISGLPFEAFSHMIDVAKLTALWLFEQYQAVGLDLWDGKFEFAWDTQKGLVFVDTIGLDEIRVTQGRTVLSKEFLRQFYRNTDWYPVIKACQEETPDVFALEKHTLPQPPQLPHHLQKTACNVYETVLDVIWPEHLSRSERDARLSALSLELRETQQSLT
jgi:phosphoribosylaminoimidazole-succinocarboxamide synthase